MADNVLLNKAAIIERCLKRVAEEYQGHESELESSFTRQDAIVLNLLRACEAAIDLAMHLVRMKRLGLPQESREAFRMLETAGIISPDLSTRMQRMIGFRNIAVHEYQKLDLVIVRNVLDKRLGDFREFVALVLQDSKSADQE